MADALDQKGLEAATDAYNEFECGSDVDHVRKIVRAYLSTVIPAEIAGVVDTLRETAIGCDHMNESGLRDMCNEAATLIERLAASQAETRRLALEALTGMITVGEAYLPYDAPNGPCAKRLSVARRALSTLQQKAKADV